MYTNISTRLYSIDNGNHSMCITICPILKLIKIRNINDNGRIIYLMNSIMIMIGIIIIGDVGIIL